MVLNTHTKENTIRKNELQLKNAQVTKRQHVMSLFIPLGGRNSTMSREASLTKYLNRVKVVVVAAVLVHYAEAMTVEMKLVSVTGRLWRLAAGSRYRE